MIRSIDDPVSIMKGLLESLLISYRHDGSTQRLEVVFDYWKKTTGADRAFLRLRFSGVSEFSRTSGLVPDLQRFAASFSTADVKGGYVLQSVEIGQHNGIRVALGFGHSFGGISFNCTEVTADVRNARANKNGADWDYFDFDDGTPIQFEAPFG